MTNEPWRVYLRRDGKTEATVYVSMLGRQLDVYRSARNYDVYDYADIMPTTREMFADFTRTVWVK